MVTYWALFPAVVAEVTEPDITIPADKVDVAAIPTSIFDLRMVIY